MFLAISVKKHEATLIGGDSRVNLFTLSSAISAPSGAPSKAWQNLQIERYLPYELTIT